MVSNKNPMEIPIFLIWLYNPYLFFYGCTQIRDKDSFSIFNTNIYEYHLKYPILKMEMNYCNDDLKHIEVWEKMNSLFKYNIESFVDKALILSTTFFLSVMLATNEWLRLKFYESFSGWVPAITQFLLNNIWTGPIHQKKEMMVVKCQLDGSAQFIVDDGDLNSTGFFNTDYLQEKNSGSDEDIVLWFEWLEAFCANDNLFFHFVPLTKTPMQSDNGPSLLAFNQPILNFSMDSSVNINPKWKENYLLLNQVLNPWLVNFSTYDNEEETDRVGDDPLTFLRPNFSSEERRIAEKLFDFIIHCNEEDLV